jgi:hypothetical protein
MEYLSMLGGILVAYVLFVVGFFRFLGLMHKKEAAVVRHSSSR